MIWKVWASPTSNGRFAVDREFEGIEFVSWGGLGEVFGPPVALCGPLWGVRGSHELLRKCVFQLLGKLGGRNQSSENVDKYACSTFR